jgi:uncharacterized protein (DUF433 family)
MHVFQFSVSIHNEIVGKSWRTPREGVQVNGESRLVANAPRVESVPGKVSGVWVLRGTRTPVKVLFENLEAGMSIEEVIEQFPVTREQLDSLMAFVARSLEEEPRYA